MAVKKDKKTKSVAKPAVKAPAKPKTQSRTAPVHSKAFAKPKLASTKLSARVKVKPIRHKDMILVLDFGSQYTQLIARRIREAKVYSQIVPYNTPIEKIQEMTPKGIILSGGPRSVYDKNAPMPDKKIFELGVPVLGICYGMQAISTIFGGKVKQSKDREFGRAELFVDNNRDLLSGIPANVTCWMSHSDEITALPKGFIRIAHTLNASIAAMANLQKKIYAVQFHPEVVHTHRGEQMLKNFAYAICGCLPRWTTTKFVEAKLKEIKTLVGTKNVVLGLSGGVDSSVAALLIHKAIGKQLYCIFVDNGLLRKNEAQNVIKTFAANFKLHLVSVDAEKRFLERLKGVTDPEEKRKIIGDEFVRVFQEKADKISNVAFLGQGTLYPDVIESVSVNGGPSEVIKSHHNVGGLPKNMKLSLIEPLRDLFKDEARQIGAYLGIPDVVLNRHPFPGPGLAIRILGEVTKERLEILREADDRLLEEIRKAGLYSQIWQAFAVLLPVKTVGVMGDQRTYENVLAIRCVTSTDGMTADWAEIPNDVLKKISNRIINEVRGVNRVVYDISSKPPATIEWE